MPGTKTYLPVETIRSLRKLRVSDSLYVTLAPKASASPCHLLCNACRSVTADLLQRYLEVEEVFQADGAATEQEVIDALRKVCAKASQAHRLSAAGSIWNDQSAAHDPARVFCRPCVQAHQLA